MPPPVGDEVSTFAPNWLFSIRMLWFPELDGVRPGVREPQLRKTLRAKVELRIVTSSIPFMYTGR